MQDFAVAEAWLVSSAGDAPASSQSPAPFLTRSSDDRVQVNGVVERGGIRPSSLLRAGEDDGSGTGWAQTDQLLLGAWLTGSYAARLVLTDGTHAIGLWSAYTPGPSPATPEAEVAGVETSGVASATQAPDGSFQVVPVGADGKLGQPVNGTASGSSPALLTRGLLHLPAGNRYILEGGQDLGTRMQLRDTTTWQTSPVNGIPSVHTWYQPLPSTSANALYFAYLSGAVDGKARLITGQVIYTGGQWSSGQGEFITDVTTSPTACGAVADLGGGKVELVTIDAVGDGKATPQVVTVTGTVPADGSVPVWDPAQTATLDLPSTVRATAVWPVPMSGGLAVLVQAVFTDTSGAHSQMWLATRQPDSSAWDSCVLLDSGATIVDVEHDGPALALLVRRDAGQAAGTPIGYEVWRRSDDGSFSPSFVDVESWQATPTESQGYRIGISALTANNEPAPATFTVTSSESVRCTVDGSTVLLQPSGYSITCAGSTWITLPMNGRLGAPTLTLTAPGLADPLVIHPERGVQNLLATVTAADLTAATDPRTGAPLLRPGVSAQDLSSVLNQVMAQVQPPTTPDAAAQPTSGGWEIDATGPTPVITFLSGQEADERLAAALANPPVDVSTWPACYVDQVYPAGLGGFLGDAWDFLCEGARAVWHGVVDVTHVVMQGATAVITFGVDGVKHIVQAVIDTVDRALDAVNCVLHAAGIAMGQAVGWLLSKLGFLFDWDSVKQRRDAVRVALKHAISLAMAKIPDPALGAGAAAASVSGARQQLDDWFTALGSDPMAKSSLPASAAVAGAANGISSELWAAVTWLLDKAGSALRLPTDLLAGPSIPGLGDAAQQTGTALTDAATASAATLADLGAMLMRLMTDPRAALNTPLGQLLGPVQHDLDATLDATANTVTSAGTFAHLLWANPDQIVDWLDTPFPSSYFTGFYRGLTDRDASAYELMCMAVAVCVTEDVPTFGALEGPAHAWSADLSSAVDYEWYQTVGIVLGSVIVPLTGAVTFCDAMALAPWTTAFSAVRLTLVVTRMSVLAVAATNDRTLRAIVYAGDGLFLLAGLVMFTPQARAALARLSELERQEILFLVSLVLLIVDTVREPLSWNSGITGVAFAQQLFAGGQAVLKEEEGGGPLPPEAVGLYTVIQTALASMAVIFYDQAIRHENNDTR
ncbi:hypothetical protein SAMN05421678_12617 [Actinopolymorpha cephalotaxi]|nr:hypothetical protein SAMN05421678_12617 [Actinopolymorpha cephalotaxi]